MRPSSIRCLDVGRNSMNTKDPNEMYNVTWIKDDRGREVPWDRFAPPRRPKEPEPPKKPD